MNWPKTLRMVVVSNTSPISNLAYVDLLFLLKAQFGTVSVPPAVRAELNRIPNPDAKARVVRAFEEAWLIERALPDADVAAALAAVLDPGEAQAIALGKNLQAGVVLIDEKEGRKWARVFSLRVQGVLGVLLRGKQDGSIKHVAPAIRALRQEAGFWISESLEDALLEAAGEPQGARERL